MIIYKNEMPSWFCNKIHTAALFDLLDLSMISSLLDGGRNVFMCIIWLRISITQFDASWICVFKNILNVFKNTAFDIINRWKGKLKCPPPIFLAERAQIKYNLWDLYQLTIYDQLKLLLRVFILIEKYIKLISNLLTVSFTVTWWTMILWCYDWWSCIY